MEWNDENSLTLINLYHINELLWNPEHSEYKSRPKRFNALNEIANKLNTHVTEIERKIKNLTCQYYREKKKENYSKKAGSGTNSIYQSKWFAFESLSFLENKNNPSATIETNRQRPTCFVSVNQDREAQISQSRLQGDGIRTERPAFKHRVNVLRQRERKSQERDEYATYGELVAMKLKKIGSPYARSTAQYHINNILYKAEIGAYDKHPRERDSFILKDHFRAGSSSAHNDSNYDVHSQRSSSPAKSMEYDMKYEEIEELDE